GAGYYWHGVDVNVNARMKNGFTVQGGTSTGRRVPEASSLIVDNPSRRTCNTKYPFLTDYRGLASYTIPRVDVQVAATLQSRSGPELSANANIPSATIAQSLGRAVAGNPANVTINLPDAGQMYGARVTQLDFRIAKIVRLGKTRTNIGLDVYNV